MNVRIKYLFVSLLFIIMFSLGAVAASENITSYGGEFDSLSSIDVAETEMNSKISNSRSIEEESILNSSYGGKVGKNNNYNLFVFSFGKITD